ncbi:hypothetical protein [Aeromicrobium sp. Root472D3]|uniref:hypothetical protein n=1 Tax=Aeromicrobium sp. Root472D3 TaxID=1736540 RepID=UPI0006F417CF|nr:hypothetical protein [Aeromicrobium sp. Root472D3]KQX75595.1 hypothetical protein ASD10_10640 [Aeromicrobium sp. Root472D3]
MIRRAALVLLGLALGVTGTLGVTTWLDGRRAHLESDGNSIGVPIATREPGDSHALQVGGVCIVGADHARITSVRAVDTIGRVEVTDFTLTAMQAMGHQEPGSIEGYVADVEAFSTGPGTTRLSTRCSDDYDLRGLVVQIADPPDAELPAVAREFAVEYEIGGRSHRLTAQTTVTLCAGDERDRDLEDATGEDGRTFDLGDCRVR